MTAGNITLVQIIRLVTASSLLGVWGIRAGGPLPWPNVVAEGATLVELYGDDCFFEGPTWDPQTGKLYFSALSQTNQQILRLDEPGKVTVWLDQTEGINGTFLSNDGRLLAVQAYGHRVKSFGIGAEGPTDVKTLLFDPTLHQPNDLCQTPQGDIYFTDPDFKGRKTSAVYCLSSDGRFAKVITDMAVPNGVRVSPKGKVLYVSDSYAKLWKAYPIRPDGTVGQGEVFFRPQAEGNSDPDGMTIDTDGNLYMTGLGGIWVANSKGKALGFIPIPEFCSNLTFGGSEGKTLFITCSKKVYKLDMRIAGVLFGRRVWQIFRSAE
jgi:gluconolactonase